MVDDRTLIKFNLINDKDKSKLKEFFKNNVVLKEIYIDIYSENPLINSIAPFMLLLRSFEKEVTVLNEGDRLIIEKHDTYFMNILFSEIKECYYKSINSYCEFVLNVQNIYYKITILN